MSQVVRGLRQGEMSSMWARLHVGLARRAARQNLPECRGLRLPDHMKHSTLLQNKVLQIQNGGQP